MKADDKARTVLGTAMLLVLALLPSRSAAAAADAQARSEHWSLQPVKMPVAPVLSAQSGRAPLRLSTDALSTEHSNPIDGFILARLATNNLTLAPATDRSTLIRRLSFDLIGLPPTPREIDEFVRDKSPQAYEQLVERLLGSDRKSVV